MVNLLKDKFWEKSKPVLELKKTGKVLFFIFYFSFLNQ